MPPAGVEPTRLSTGIFKIPVATYYTKGADSASIAQREGVCTISFG